LDRKVLAKDYMGQLLSQRCCSTNKYLIEGCHNKTKATKYIESTLDEIGKQNNNNKKQMGKACLCTVASDQLLI